MQTMTPSGKMGELKLYFDIMSQPSRAILLFLKANNIPFIEKQIHLRKGEQLSEEFAKINPLRKVPVIDDNGFILTESVAILKYLCGSRRVADHWYPADVHRHARVDEFNAWQHANLRMNGSLLFRKKEPDTQGNMWKTTDCPGDIFESDAILRYLSTTRTADSFWYRRDAKARARVDEFLAWQYAALHGPCLDIYNHQYIEPRLKNIPVDREMLQRLEASLDQTLDHLENVFLRNQNYLCGDDISIADLLAICELMQADAVGHDLTTGRPRVAGWIDHVKVRLQPHFDDVHSLLNAVREKFVKTPANL